MDAEAVKQAREGVRQALASGKSPKEVMAFLQEVGYTKEDIAQVVSKETLSPAVKCPKCNTYNSKEDNFCVTCGTPLNKKA